MAKVIIFGTRDNALLAHFYLTGDSKHEVVAFTMNKEFIKEDKFLDLPVVAFEEIENLYHPSDYLMFVPMSPAKVNEIRAQKYLEAKKKGYGFISYISSRAAYYNTEVGENCFILENNCIQPFTKIGNNVMIWSGNHIGHQSQIKDHAYLTSHVVVSGHVVIGEYSFLGVNCTIKNGIRVGRSNIIGAGALVMRDTKDFEVYAGNKSEASKVRSSQLKDF